MDSFPENKVSDCPRRGVLLWRGRLTNAFITSGSFLLACDLTFLECGNDFPLWLSV
jgi:hypothetical protein